MAVWTPNDSNFAIKIFFKDNSFNKTKDCSENTSTLAYMAVPDRSTTAIWVIIFRNTALAQKKIEGSVKTVRTRHEMEIVRVIVTGTPPPPPRKQAFVATSFQCVLP